MFRRLAVGREADQVHHERLMQCRDLLGRRGGQALCEHRIGLALHGTLEAAKGFVLLQRETRTSHAQLPQFLQGEGQQGKGISGFGVSH